MTLPAKSFWKNYQILNISLSFQSTKTKTRNIPGTRAAISINFPANSKIIEDNFCRVHLIYKPVPTTQTKETIMMINDGCWKQLSRKMHPALN